MAHQLDVPCPYSGDPISVELHQYQRPVPPYTHWYMHPTTNEPVPVMVLDTSTEADPTLPTNEVAQQLERAIRSGKYMVAIWSFADGPLSLYRMTQEFPREAFTECVAMLDKMLQAENEVPMANRDMPTVFPPQRGSVVRPSDYPVITQGKSENGDENDA